jgi:hypothetical protein
MTYLLRVMASTVKRETATNPYRRRGSRTQRVCPCRHALCQKSDATRGRLKQQSIKSETLRLMMNTAVAFRTCNHNNNIPLEKKILEKNIVRANRFMAINFCYSSKLTTMEFVPRATIFVFSQIYEIDMDFRHSMDKKLGAYSEAGSARAQ